MARKQVALESPNTEGNNFSVAEIILEQLGQSRVNGFPFFAYTGIKNYTMTEDGELLLRQIPKNPNKIDSIWIRYDEGADLYNVTFQISGVPVRTEKGIFCDQMAEMITRFMGVA